MELTDELLEVLPMNNFCYDRNCPTTRTYVYALENNKPENIEIQTKVCVRRCDAYLFNKYQNGEPIEKKSPVHANNLHLKKNSS